MGEVPGGKGRGPIMAAQRLLGSCDGTLPLPLGTSPIDAQPPMPIPRPDPDPPKRQRNDDCLRGGGLCPQPLTHSRSPSLSFGRLWVGPGGWAGVAGASMGEGQGVHAEDFLT